MSHYENDIVLIHILFRQWQWVEWQTKQKVSAETQTNRLPIDFLSLRSVLILSHVCMFESTFISYGIVQSAHMFRMHSKLSILKMQCANSFMFYVSVLFLVHFVFVGFRPRQLVLSHVFLGIFCFTGPTIMICSHSVTFFISPFIGCLFVWVCVAQIWIHSWTNEFQRSNHEHNASNNEEKKKRV